MKPLLKLFIFLIFIDCTICYSQKDLVCRLQDIPQDWAVLDMRKSQNKCCPLGTECNIYEILNTNGHNVLDVCDVSRIPNGWEYVHQYKCLGNCCSGSGTRYLIRRKQNSNTNPSTPKLTSPAKPKHIQPINVNGFFLGLVTVSDVKIAYVFLKSIASDPNEKADYLGEYKFYNFTPKSSIEYCNEPIFHKKTIKEGVYRLIAVEKTENKIPQRFEKTITILANQCTFQNIDFNYSYLYYTAHMVLGKEPKKIPANFVDISIDDGPWFNESCPLNTEDLNASLCNTNYPPVVLKPNVSHTIKARYRFTNGEVKIVSKDFTLKENSCRTINLDFN